MRGIASSRLVAPSTDPAGGLVTEMSYTYDGHSNRTSRTRFDGTISTTDQYTYNTAGQLVEVNGETLSYDANGNLTGTSTGAELTYNAADQTVSIRPRADQGIAAEYGYRGAGQAERATATPASTSADPVCAPLIGCLDSPSLDVSTSNYTHSLLGVAAETVVEDTTPTTTGFVRDPSGRLLGAHTADQDWFYLTDAIGTVVGITDEDGATLAAYRYDPFGQTTGASGRAAELNRWRFAGAYLDVTGLYKIGQRYYHPGWARWTQPDPILAPLDPVNWNRYVYAGNNPVNYTDPTGYNAVSDWFSDRWDEARCVASIYLEPFSLGWTAGSVTIFLPFRYAALEALKGMVPTMSKMAVRSIGWAAGAAWFGVTQLVRHHNGRRSFMDCF